MKKNLIKILLPVTLSMLALNACKKNDVAPPILDPVALAPAVGEYVLSEGGFGNNNTKLSYHDNTANTTAGDFFLQQNPTIPAGLGDTGNDMLIYGSKLYVVVNNSSVVIVLNASNATFIKKILFQNGTAPKSPRYAVSARGKVFVTSSDNTVSVIDTSSLTIVNSITTGANPEGIAASANYLYVANSGGFNAVPDSTVSLIDLNTLTEIRKIKVGVNPNKVEINTAGNIYVSAYGNFTSIPPSVSIINGTTNVTSINLGTGFNYSHIRISGDIAYLYNNYGGTGTSKVYNTTTNTIVRNEFITDGTVVNTAYGINIDEQNGDVYIANAPSYTSAGSIICFTSGGVKKFSFSVAPGINPNKILFRR